MVAIQDDPRAAPNARERDPRTDAESVTEAAAAAVIPEEALPDAGTSSGELLRVSGVSRDLAKRPTRDWLLPGADEYFRRIYTRTGAARSEVLAVCSALAGEGKTTIGI